MPYLTEDEVELDQQRQDADQRAAKVGAVLALIVVIAVVAWLLWPKTGTIPNVVGLDEAAARSAIEQAGLRVGTVATRTADTVGTGVVLSQMPPSGLKVRLGDEIDFTVADGAFGFAGEFGPPDSGSAETSGMLVPDVVGKQDAEARTLAEVLGLELVIDSRQASSMPVNEVIKQWPERGTAVDVGSELHVTLSTGVPARGSASVSRSGPDIPEVLGMTAGGARSRLSSSGYATRVVYAPSTSTSRGHVFWQSPGPGIAASRPAAVEIWISTGVPTKGAPYPKPPDNKQWGRGLGQ